MGRAGEQREALPALSSAPVVPPSDGIVAPSPRSLPVGASAERQV